MVTVFDPVTMTVSDPVMVTVFDGVTMTVLVSSNPVMVTVLAPFNTVTMTGLGSRRPRTIVYKFERLRRPFPT